MTMTSLSASYENIKAKFDEKYSCEEITSNSSNLELIKKFSGGALGAGVEHYLKDKAWDASTSGESRVYLVKERKTGVLRAYYSIKCGMLFSPLLVDRIDGDDRDFLQLLIDAIRNNDNEALTDYSSSGLYEDNVFKKLYDEALRIVSYERENVNHKSHDVAYTYPAIEIENLCKNFAIDEKEAVPLGFMVFWLSIIPKIHELTKCIGCKYIYLFAADKTELSGSKTQSLINYYRTNFGFHDADSLYFIRPRYDEKCYEMVQSIEEVLENSRSIWDQFEGVIDFDLILGE